MSPHPHGKRSGVARLHEYGPRAGELAHQAFTRADARDDTTARHPLHYILAIPGYQMTVINDILLLRLKLRTREHTFPS